MIATMKPFRKDRIASQVMRIVGETIAQHINDPRVDSLTTVTRVEVSADLLVAKVFLSVPGRETAERRTLAGIRSAAGFIQRTVAQALSIRQCPELKFDIDEQAKMVRRTMEILAENRRNDPSLGGEAESASGEPSEEDGVEDESESGGVQA
jgi:ribosome-binding factor A